MTTYVTASIARGKEKSTATVTNAAGSSTIDTAIGAKDVMIVINQTNVGTKMALHEHVERLLMRLEEGVWTTGA